MQTHAGGFIRSTTITTASDGNGNKVQLPNIQKKESRKQLYPVAKRGSGGPIQAVNRVRSEQRQGVTRTNTAVYTTQTQSSFHQS